MNTAIATVRLGVILPSVNTVVEPWYGRVMPPGVTVHAARMFLDANLTPEIDQAIADIKPVLDKYLEDVNKAVTTAAKSPTTPLPLLRKVAETRSRYAPLGLDVTRR